jgi:hypothetical protein
MVRRSRPLPVIIDHYSHPQMIRYCVFAPKIGVESANSRFTGHQLVKCAQDCPPCPSSKFGLPSTSSSTSAGTDLQQDSITSSVTARRMRKYAKSRTLGRAASETHVCCRSAHHEAPQFSSHQDTNQRLMRHDPIPSPVNSVSLVDPTKGRQKEDVAVPWAHARGGERGGRRPRQSGHVTAIYSATATATWRAVCCVFPSLSPSLSPLLPPSRVPPGHESPRSPYLSGTAASWIGEEKRRPGTLRLPR